MHNDDINLKGILAFLVILVATIFIMYGAVSFLRRSFERKAQNEDRRTLAVANDPQRPYFPFPREQPAPLIDLQAVRARENSNLTTYGWVNRSNGVTHIPIDRAINLLSTNPERRP